MKGTRPSVRPSVCNVTSCQRLNLSEFQSLYAVQLSTPTLCDTVLALRRTQWWTAVMLQNGDLSCTVRKLRKISHFVSIVKTIQLMLYWTIIAVCVKISTAHLTSLCGQNLKLLGDELVAHKRTAQL